MKAGSAAYLCVVVCLSLFLITSCGHYVDTASTERSIPIMQGTFDFYADSNVLVYKSKVGLTMDTETYKPKAFYIKLPKGLKWYTMENSQSFVFYYGKDQAVAIFIDLFNSDHLPDSDYIPTDQDIRNVTMKESSGATVAYDIRKMKPIAGRKQFMKKRGAATILLYNIPPGKYETFIKFVDSFKFL